MDKIVKPLLVPVSFLAAVSIGFWPIFPKILQDWSSGDNNYCYLIIPLVAYLCWELKDKFRFSEYTYSWIGLPVLIVASFLILLGELGSAITLSYIGLWLAVVSLALMLYGSRSWFLLFPLIILFFIVPLPGFINNLLTFKLKMAASKFSVQMLQLTGISVFLEGNIIDLGSQKLQVVDACSGLRYFMPMILMSLLVGYFFVKKLWQRLFLLILVVPLSVFINAFRIWLTGVLSVSGHPELAENLFHDFSGWLVFMIAGAFLIGFALLLKKIGGGAQHKRAIAATDPVSDVVDTGAPEKPLSRVFTFAAVICVVLLASGFLFQRSSSAYQKMNRTTFKNFPMHIGKWDAKRNFLSDEILGSLWADDYVNATYFSPDSSNIIYLLVPYYEYQGTKHTAHAPQACLLGGGYSLTKSEPKKIKVSGDKKIEVMTMLLKKGEITMIGSYFFLQRGRVITSPWLNKFYLMWDSITRNRTDGALVRVELLTEDRTNLDQAYAELEDFISQLWQILPRYVPE